MITSKYLPFVLCFRYFLLNGETKVMDWGGRGKTFRIFNFQNKFIFKLSDIFLKVLYCQIQHKVSLLPVFLTYYPSLIPPAVFWVSSSTKSPHRLVFRCLHLKIFMGSRAIDSLFLQPEEFPLPHICCLGLMLCCSVAVNVRPVFPLPLWGCVSLLSDGWHAPEKKNNLGSDPYYYLPLCCL